MLEPLTTQITFLLAASSLSAALAVTVVSPASWATEVASILVGLAGGLMVQLWTNEARKPTRRVMAADMIASGFSGLLSRVAGVPMCIAFVNKFLPKDFAIDAAVMAENIWTISVIAFLSGAVGAGIIRKGLDRLNPEWMSGGSNKKP